MLQVLGVVLAVGIAFMWWQSGRRREREALSTYSERTDSWYFDFDFVAMTCTVSDPEIAESSPTHYQIRRQDGAWSWRLAPDDAAEKRRDLEGQLKAPKDILGDPREIDEEERAEIEKDLRSINKWTPVTKVHTGALDSQYERYLAAHR